MTNQRADTVLSEETESTQLHTAPPALPNGPGTRKKILKSAGVFVAIILSVIVIAKTLPLHNSLHNSQPGIEELPGRDPRIIHPLQIDQYPTHTVFLEIKKRYKYGASSCTGSILTKNIILTAAHCFISREGSMDFVPQKSSLDRVRSVTIHVGVKEKNIEKYYRRWRKYHHEQKIVMNYDELQQSSTTIESILRLSPHWFRSLSDKRKLQLEHGDIALIMLPKDKEIDMVRTKTEPINIFAPGYKFPIPKISAQTEWRMNNRNATVVGYGKIDPYNQVTKGLGTHHFKIMTKSNCKDHMRAIGWFNDLDLMDVKHIFCAKGMKLEYLKPTQVCSGDSGGPIFVDISLITLQDKTLLYQLTKKMQIGITVWVDSKCTDNFNGFMAIYPYLDWIKSETDEESWKEINERIFPGPSHVSLYESYKSLILNWRQRTNN